MEQTPIERLKKTIIENMEGIVVDHKARKDKDIVEFYADVFVLIAVDFSEQLQAKHKEEVKQAIIEAYSYGCIEFGALEYTNLTYIEKAEAYYETNHVTPVKD